MCPVTMHTVLIQSITLFILGLKFSCNFVVIEPGARIGAAAAAMSKPEIKTEIESQVIF